MLVTDFVEEQAGHIARNVYRALDDRARVIVLQFYLASLECVRDRHEGTPVPHKLYADYASPLATAFMILTALSPRKIKTRDAMCRFFEGDGRLAFQDILSVSPGSFPGIRSDWSAVKLHAEQMETATLFGKSEPYNLKRLKRPLCDEAAQMTRAAVAFVYG
jgi:hypothetical protein